jgi:hypothetical protein
MLVASGCTFAPPHGAEKSPATAWNLFQKQMT